MNETKWIHLIFVDIFQNEEEVQELSTQDFNEKNILFEFGDEHRFCSDYNRNIIQEKNCSNQGKFDWMIVTYSFEVFSIPLASTSLQ